MAVIFKRKDLLFANMPSVVVLPEHWLMDARRRRAAHKLYHQIVGCALNSIRYAFNSKHVRNRAASFVHLVAPLMLIEREKKRQIRGKIT